MKNPVYLIAPLILSFYLVGCSTSTVSFKPVSPSNTTAPTSPSATSETPAPKKSLSDWLTDQASTVTPGKTIAKMATPYDWNLFHYAFVSPEGKPLFVYEEVDNFTSLLVLRKDLTLEKQTRFPDVNLKKAFLNNKILYIGYKLEDRAFKYNTSSHDYSEVSKNEMERSRAIQEEDKLPGGEPVLFTREGYAYTGNGLVFDTKQHDYLYDPANSNTKKQFYPKALFGYGSYLLSFEPRQDAAFNLTLIQADGEKTHAVGSYPIHLDLPAGYPIQQLEYTMKDNGDILIFAVGVDEGSDQVVKVFELPLGTKTTYK